MFGEIFSRKISVGSRRKREIQRGTFVPVEILIDCSLFQRNWERMPVSGDQVRFLTKVNPSSGIVRGGEGSSHVINYPSVDISAKYFDGLLCCSTHSSSLSRNSLLSLFPFFFSSLKKRNIIFERFVNIGRIEMFPFYKFLFFFIILILVICLRCRNVTFDDRAYLLCPKIVPQDYLEN